MKAKKFTAKNDPFVLRKEVDALMKALLFIPLILCSQLISAQKLSTRTNSGILGPTGNALVESYSIGLTLEPGLVYTVTDGIEIGVSGVVHGFINEYNDDLTDYLVLYGPFLSVSYKGLAIRKLEFQPLLGAGYLWGRDFLVSKASTNNDRETTTVLYSHGTYWRIGFLIPASSKMSFGIFYNFHRPIVSMSEDAKLFFSSSNINSPLYGSIIDFPLQRLSFDNMMLAIVFKL